jgi:hypothetical protein
VTGHVLAARGLVENTLMRPSCASLSCSSPQVLVRGAHAAASLCVAGT